jgi:hypothetical protein
MGIRLYPNTQKVQSLEVLAGVPAGTAARLEAVKARHAEEAKAWAFKTLREREDAEYAQWKEKQADGHIGTYDTFLVFGWGKFRDHSEDAPGCAGSLSDPAAIARLLAANGLPTDPVFIALTEGVFWS